MKNREFKLDKTTILLSWSNVNQAWLVWRRDGDYDDIRNMRVHTEYADAEADYQHRSSFLIEVMAAKMAANQ